MSSIETFHRSRRALALAVVVLAVAAACTNGDDDADEPRTRTTTGVTDDVVLVAPAAPDLEANVGAAARFARANDEGGVSGRRVDLGGLPDDSFAIVPAVGVDPDPATDPEVPTFGWSATTAFCGRDDAFALNGCQEVGSDVWGALLALDGLPSDAAIVVVVDESSGSFDTDAVAGAFAASGASVDVLTIRSGPGAELPESSRTVEGVLASEPDLVAYVADPPVMVRLAAALVEAGYAGAHTSRLGYAPEVAAALARAGVDDVTVVIDFAPFESADDNPLVQRLVDDVRTYEDDEGITATPLSGDVAAGYWAADAFLRVLEATGADLTRERLLQVANDALVWEAEGTAGPATWPRNHRVPVPCGSLVRAVGGEFEVAVPYSCGQTR